MRSPTLTDTQAFQQVLNFRLSMKRIAHYKEIIISHLVYGIWILFGGVLYSLG